MVLSLLHWRPSRAGGGVWARGWAPPGSGPFAVFPPGLRPRAQGRRMCPGRAPAPPGLAVWVATLARTRHPSGSRTCPRTPGGSSGVWEALPPPDHRDRGHVLSGQHCPRPGPQCAGPRPLGPALGRDAPGRLRPGGSPPRGPSVLLVCPVTSGPHPGPLRPPQRPLSCWHLS